MFRQILKSKIQDAVVTKKELYYSCSIGIDRMLLLKSDMIPNEKVEVLNFNNGQRFETYIIEEKENSGIIALYGPAARLGEIGDKLCVLSYLFACEDELEMIRPKIMIVEKGNKIK